MRFALHSDDGNGGCASIQRHCWTVQSCTFPYILQHKWGHMHDGVASISKPLLIVARGNSRWNRNLGFLVATSGSSTVVSTIRLLENQGAIVVNTAGVVAIKLSLRDERSMRHTGKNEGSDENGLNFLSGTFRILPPMMFL